MRKQPFPIYLSTSYFLYYWCFPFYHASEAIYSSLKSNLLGPLFLPCFRIGWGKISKKYFADENENE